MSFQRLGFAAFALFIGAKAIDSITAPNVVAASTPFTLQVTPKDGASGSYRILLDTTPPGFNGGQSCYLKNSTSSDITTVNLTIPADFGPNGDFYSISVRDLSDMDTKSNYVFSNAFNLTGATGVYTEYENKLNGAPLWDANSLPCTSYNCARKCAQASYPGDMIPGSEDMNTMNACILACPGVSDKTVTSSSSSATSSATGTKTGPQHGASASATASSPASDASSSAAAASASVTGAASMSVAPFSLVAAGGLLALCL